MYYSPAVKASRWGNHRVRSSSTSLSLARDLLRHGGRSPNCVANEGRHEGGALGYFRELMALLPGAGAGAGSCRGLELLTLGGLAGEEEGLREPAFSANLECAEIFEPEAFRG